jgi:hypothetical protein
VENFGKRTTASLGIVFALLMIGWLFAVEEMGKPVVPPAHCDIHLSCKP